MDTGDAVRLLLFHKQATSGRTRFLRFGHGMLAFAPLPPLSNLRAPQESVPAIRHHPAAYLHDAAQRFDLPEAALRVESAFQAVVDTPAGDVEVILAGFATVDPPFIAADRLGGKFVAITEARGTPPVELQLLRRAYETVLG